MAVQTIGVVGSGVMGAGIAQVAAQVGRFDVIVHDIEQRFIDRGIETIGKSTARMVAKGTLTQEDAAAAVARIRTSLDIGALAEADFVIEAASEDFEIKRRIFSALDGVCRADAFLATNTSSYPITQVGACTARPERVVGMHFFNPAPVMKLVEVIRGLVSSAEAVDTACAVAERMGKTVVQVKDTAGFVVNRVLLPMINEAVYLLAEGTADATAIDEAMKLGAAHPMGPLALADLIGLDVCLHIMETLHRELGEDKYRPCPLLRSYVHAGRLGRKSGSGFFAY